jgi:hypothetical protein
MGASAPQCVAKGRIQHSDTWSGEGSCSVSQSGGKEGPTSHCHRRLPKIISIPMADVFRSAKPRPMLCHIVTGLRHLLFRPAPMRVSQASVAELLQRLAGWRPDAMHFGGVSDARPPMSARVCDLRKRRAPSRLRQLNCPSTQKLNAQQRDVTPRLMMTRFRSGASSMAISPRPSASRMAARALALPMLARSAIRATGRVHFPVV